MLPIETTNNINPPTKIMVIDDDKNLLLAVTQTLKSAGFEVHHADDGITGITKIQSLQPDLVLLDINMPRMNGFEVKKILDIYPTTQDIPVIFFTAHSDRNHMLEGYNLGVDYINKPIEADILVGRIKAVIKRVDKGYKRAITDSKIGMFAHDPYQQWGQMVEIHDFGTGGHTVRVTNWFAAMAKFLGIKGIDLENAKKGAMLHDIGKLAIPQEILNKPGPLNEAEWVLMHKHPLFGYQMLSTIPSLKAVGEIPLHHHEHWNGMGYPDHLQGYEIPLIVRIFSLADNYDALISKRPYKIGFSDEEALEIIESQSGKMYDPALVNIFLKNCIDFKNTVGQGSAPVIAERLNS